MESRSGPERCDCRPGKFCSGEHLWRGEGWELWWNSRKLSHLREIRGLAPKSAESRFCLVDHKSRTSEFQLPSISLRHSSGDFEPESHGQLSVRESGPTSLSTPKHSQPCFFSCSTSWHFMLMILSLLAALEREGLLSSAGARTPPSPNPQ